MNTHRSEVGHGWQELWSGVGPGGGQYIGDFTIGQVLDRADELWAQSAGHVAGTGAVPDKSYKDAQRHLTTRGIWYKDGNGAYVSTKVTVKLHEGARFDAAANGMYGGTLSADGMTWTGSTQTNLGDAGLQLRSPPPRMAMDDTTPRSRTSCTHTSTRRTRTATSIWLSGERTMRTPR